MSLSSSLFQEPWWLSAVTGGGYDEVTVTQGNQVVGRLPFIATRQGPFRISIMPEFTHLLGPAIDTGVGKPQTQLLRRLSIARNLIDQLPPFAFFMQALDPCAAGGLALADGQAFQARSFQVRPQYTFQMDCHADLEIIWHGMQTTVRRDIRRAEERYSVIVLDDPDHFVHFYLQNLKKRTKTNYIGFNRFPTLFSACTKRMSGEILCALNSDGGPAAMVFLVWGHGVMYYLLSTRAPDIGDRGSVSLLLWSAIKRANQLKLMFDLDGVYSSGTARFLGAFGGKIGVRLIVARAQPIYRTIQFMKSMLAPSGNYELVSFDCPTGPIPSVFSRAENCAVQR